MITYINPDQFVVESNGNLGAVEITTFLSLILYGVSLSQGYTYFRRSASDDRLALKLLVRCLSPFALQLLETFHSFTAATAIYYDTITRWKTAEANSYPIATNILIETLITLLVQCFFSFRIYRLSGRLSICAVCCSLALLRFIGGIATCVEDFLDVPNKPFNGIVYVIRFRWLITSTFAIGGATDVLIAIFMSYYLRKLASPWNLKSTTDILNRLIRWSLQTGMITSMTSVAVIICVRALILVWFSLYIILAKVYSNSLLVSLNARPRESSPINTEKPVTTTLRFERFQGPRSVSFQPTNAGDTFDKTLALPPKVWSSINSESPFQ
ncbi:hypothetical protein BDZ97DRAFT_1782826 [Flammula alnicola]|nr:hypothetical protein BDZ97DRAFT_1782826 [Flammula alnicola]